MAETAEARQGETATVCLVDKEVPRAEALGRLLADAGASVWRWDLGNDEFVGLEDRGGLPPKEFDLELRHIGDDPTAGPKANVTVYYGGEGAKDDRFEEEESELRGGVRCGRPGGWADAPLGVLLRRVVLASNIGVTGDHLQAVLGWARRLASGQEMETLPAVLVPPSLSEDESALYAIAFLCQCELASYRDQMSTGEVGDALRQMGMTDASGERVALGVEADSAHRLAPGTWRLGLGDVPPDLTAKMPAGEGREAVKKLLAAVRERDDKGGSGSVREVDPQIVARAYLALDWHFGDRTA